MLKDMGLVYAIKGYRDIFDRACASKWLVNNELCSCIGSGCTAWQICRLISKWCK